MLITPFYVIRYLDTVMAFVWDSVIFHNIADPASILGAALILSGCLVSVFAKTISSMLPNCSCSRTKPGSDVGDSSHSGIQMEENIPPA